MQVGTTDATLQTGVAVSAARERQIFRLFVEANTGTTQPVSLGFCNGGGFPIFLQSTGIQATAATFVAGVTYLVTFDDFSGKFFLVGF
jgi:hypothetical protein